MRIDKFLKVSRILKRRETANKAVECGRVKVNGNVVKPSYRVKVDDIVEINFGTGNITFKVLDIKDTVKKEEASSLYEIIMEL